VPPRQRTTASSLPSDQSWRERADCLDRDSADYFPDEGGIGYRATEQRCVDFCHVAQQCLDAGYLGGEKYGIWGGIALHGRGMTKGSYLAQSKVLQER
jgi:hypothetical protein